MKKISDFIRGNEHNGDLSKLKKELLQDKEISDLASGMDIDNFLVGLIDYKMNKAKCEKCAGLDSCNQHTKGLAPLAERIGNTIEFSYETCAIKTKEMNRKKTTIRAMHMPSRILSITPRDIEKTEDRKEVLDYLNKFVKGYSNSTFVKGAYIHGRFSVGKTYILSAMANDLHKRGLDVIIAYFPDLSRELLSGMDDGTLESKIRELKNVDVLMLDDIGGESVNEYFRDQILGPILQHRMLGEKATFFTSNLSYKELVSHFAQDKRTFNETKAFRIIERIKGMSTPFELKSKFER